MKKIIMSLCLLISCGSFASNHLTSNELIEFKAKYLQKKEEIRLIKHSINELKNDIFIQSVSNLEIEPLKNTLKAFNDILDKGYEPYPNWIFNKITNLEEGIQRKNFYLQAKSDAYGQLEKNYAALISYIDEHSSNNIQLQGGSHFSVNGVTVLDY